MNAAAAPSPPRFRPRGRVGARAMVIVGTILLVSALLHATSHLQDLRSPAIAFSMIVEMTSLTPRVARRTPAMPAQTAPTAIATMIASTVLR